MATGRVVGLDEKMDVAGEFEDCWMFGAVCLCPFVLALIGRWSRVITTIKKTKTDDDDAIC